MAKKVTKPEDQPNEKPRVHKELEGFDIKINTFGEITNSYDIDKINAFLNKTVDDKKLRNRKDLKDGEKGDGEEYEDGEEE
ncbi:MULTISPECIES: hypothetical protein [Larkinella]|jgi:hypothetical protein|uniref:Uncharacterized protein n=2 Tax=Larkinella TaxID=332157 RepID=A0A5N1JEP9_9BACT|nr:MULTISPECIES: hypothetical protein [Larkinella]KAA9353522.1 hypothetical protein F0P93_12825 [Larkinella humicola]RCR68776.1 hypothetical protein DUE52_14945 [Larkinella punicea]